MELMTEQEELKIFWESELHYMLMLLEDHKKDVLDKLPKGKDPYSAHTPEMWDEELRLECELDHLNQLDK